MAEMDAVPQNDSHTKTAWILALAGVAVMAVLAAIDHDGPAWLAQPVLGAAAAWMAYRAGGTSPKNRAFMPFLIGIILVLIFLGWMISEA